MDRGSLGQHCGVLGRRSHVLAGRTDQRTPAREKKGAQAATEVRLGGLWVMAFLPPFDLGAGEECRGGTVQKPGAQGTASLTKREYFPE